MYGPHSDIDQKAKQKIKSSRNLVVFMGPQDLFEVVDKRLV